MIDYYSGEYEIGFRYWTDSFSVFSSLKLSVNYLNTKDKFFVAMDDVRPCFKKTGPSVLNHPGGEGGLV